MAEKEYIEREAVLNTVEEIMSDYNIYHQHRAIKKRIKRLPAADVVEIVRCKDCKHYDKKYHQCKLHSEEPDQYYTGFIFCMQEDDFCSYSERKELDNAKLH